MRKPAGKLAIFALIFFLVLAGTPFLVNGGFIIERSGQSSDFVPASHETGFLVSSWQDGTSVIKTTNSDYQLQVGMAQPVYTLSVVEAGQALSYELKVKQLSYDGIRLTVISNSFLMPFRISVSPYAFFNRFGSLVPLRTSYLPAILLSLTVMRSIGEDRDSGGRRIAKEQKICKRQSPVSALISEAALILRC